MQPQQKSRSTGDHRVGQNRICTPYMAVCMAVSLLNYRMYTIYAYVCMALALGGDKGREQPGMKKGWKQLIAARGDSSQAWKRVEAAIHSKGQEQPGME